MFDIASRRGIKIDLKQLSAELPIKDDIAIIKTTPHEEAIEKMPGMISQIAEDIAGIEVM